MSTYMTSITVGFSEHIIQASFARLCDVWGKDRKISTDGVLRHQVLQKTATPLAEGT